MTFACREMQNTENKGFFRLEIVGHSHTHRTLNEVLKLSMETPCQKT